MAEKKKRQRRLGAGRPDSFDDPAFVEKLENAFAQGFSVSDACILAQINRTTYYNHIKKNPAFVDRIEALRRRPYLATVMGINELIAAKDPTTLRWYAERKGKDEFSIRNELTGNNGDAINSRVIFIEPEEREEYEKHIQKTIEGEKA